MADNSFYKYHQYLKTKSIVGSFYRNYFIYRKLKRYIHGHLLDYGCGLGDMLSSYRKSIGIDINPLNINFCNQKGFKAYLIDDFQFDKYKFDTIILDNVIEHIEDPEQTVKNIYKVSAKNTILIVGVPGIKGYKFDDDHKVFYNDANLIPLFEKINYMFINSFSTPWNSKFLDLYSKRYCKYYIFKFK
jgi:SAM-dependent methyltransferase